MANISVSNITLSAIISVTVSVSSYSASASYQDITYSTDGASVSYSYEIVETIPLPSETVVPFDTPELTVNTSKTDDVTLSEGIDQFDIELVKADSVTAVESRVKVFTDFIDFDPSDDDIDPTPVTISESDTKDITVGELADNDDVTVVESISNQPDIPKSDNVTTSEAINQLRPHKNVTDTATASEAIDRFDVTTEFDDTITVTESTAKEITPAGKTDSVSAVQSNVKTFTSNIDFDLSDADVDPDPVTASDAINEFDFNKGLTDTSNVTESTAKNFTHGGLSDTASPTESTAFDITVPGFADSFSAVEGIKLNPSIPFGHSISASEAIVLDPRLVFAHSATVTESVNVVLTLGETDTLYIQRAYISDGDDSTYIRGYHRGLFETAGNIKRAVDKDIFLVNVNLLNERLIQGDIEYIEDPQEVRGFVQSPYRFRLTDFTGILGQDDSLLNLTPIHQDTQDGIGRTETTGIIGDAGLVNMVVFNADTITYGDPTNAGLVVNFMYTDTDDTALGGHYLNETPLSAGSYS